MTAFQRPGVYVQETLNPVQPVVEIGRAHV